MFASLGEDRRNEIGPELSLLQSPPEEQNPSNQDSSFLHPRTRFAGGRGMVLPGWGEFFFPSRRSPLVKPASELRFAATGKDVLPPWYAERKHGPLSIVRVSKNILVESHATSYLSRKKTTPSREGVGLKCRNEYQLNSLWPEMLSDDVFLRLQRDSRPLCPPAISRRGRQWSS